MKKNKYFVGIRLTEDENRMLMQIVSKNIGAKRNGVAAYLLKQALKQAAESTQSPYTGDLRFCEEKRGKP